jgi:hypothetical protein
MLTHHLAGDDSTKIVGRITNMWVNEDGGADYDADLADTPDARTIVTLADAAEGDPFIKNVSIRGGWIGPVRYKMVDERRTEYADDLEFDGLDFTKSPGVPGADIKSVTFTDGLPEETVGKTLIYETVAEASVVTEKGAPALKSGKPAASPTPGATKYADPGYQDDKAKRYPVDTLAHAKAAWSYINMAKNASVYTAAQLKQIKSRIAKALRGFGVKVDAAEGWAVYPTVSESVEESDIWPDQPGSFSVSVDNGTVTITVSSCQVNAPDLEMCARAAMEGVCAALAQIDPDNDGDIDSPDNDDTDEHYDDPDVVEETDPVADQPTISEAEPPTNALAAKVELPAITLTPEQLTALMATLAAPVPAVAGMSVESAPAAPVVEASQSAEPIMETTEQMIQRMVA